jgi:glucokinase-like ROK family protein
MMLSNDTRTVNLTGTELKKHRLKSRILNLLYEETTCSAPEIGKKIGVSLPTAISLLNKLKRSGQVEVCGTGISKGGRKPTLFGLSETSVYVIACELGRYQCKMVVYNPQNQKVTPLVNFETNIDDDQLVEKIFRHSKKLIRENQIDEKKIFAVGLTMPGLVDEKAGINYTIKNKRFQNVKERLEKKFKILVYINNDARMQAYGEFIFGKAKEYKNAIIVSWSWGIGMGMILNGKLFNGATGFAGEFSHIKIEKEGDLCICGKKGCLETVASANVLLNRAKSEIEKGTVSQLTVKFKDRPEELGPTDVIEAAKAGDEFSISLLNKIGLALGQGLSIAIQLLNPDIIVIGGPVSAANQFILIPIQQSLHRYCLEQIYRNTKIEISERGEESGLLGVTAILFQQLFKVE